MIKAKWGRCQRVKLGGSSNSDGDGVPARLGSARILYETGLIEIHNSAVQLLIIAASGQPSPVTLSQSDARIAAPHSTALQATSTANVHACGSDDEAQSHHRSVEMVQKKHQKSKTKKQPSSRKKGKEGDIAEFRGQLDALGLKFVEVTADGNCFFRALAGQLEGDEEEHQKYRDMVVKFIEKNREMFEPFIEDEVPFETYCRSMEKDGTWAGHMEIQAASLVTHCNICIHRSMSPRWYIRNFNDSEARMVHLSYHDGEHYNSVRLKEDTCAGPARPISIKADAGLSATSNREKATPSKSRAGYGSNVVTEGSIKLIMTGSGCGNEEKIRQVLLQVGGDTDAAIEFLIAEQGADELQSGYYTSHEVSDGNVHDNPLLSCDSGIDKEKSLSGSGLIRNNDIEEECKKTPRNKACPCGSKKKYKSCCGTATVKPSMQFPIAKTSSSRKDKKQGKKSGTFKAATTNSPEGGSPDVGALCI
ncbi:unnamed protein product [Rhodiola kirilowii]